MKQEHKKKKTQSFSKTVELGSTINSAGNKILVHIYISLGLLQLSDKQE